MSKALRRLSYIDVAMAQQRAAATRQASPDTSDIPAIPATSDIPASPDSPAEQAPSVSPSLDSTTSPVSTNRASPDSPASVDSSSIPAIRESPASPAIRPSLASAATVLSRASRAASPDGALLASLANADSPASSASPTRGLRSKLRPGREQLNVRIRSELAEQFDAWCFQNHIEKTTAIELALGRLIRGDIPASPDNPAITASPLIIDDYIDDQDAPVVEMYERLTRRPFSEKDAVSLNELRKSCPDTPTILAGMMRTALNRGHAGPINSFNYMQKEIYKVLQVGPPYQMTLPQYIQQLRTKLTRKRIL